MPMTSKMLDSSAIKELQPTLELLEMGRKAPRYPFVARSRTEAIEWQKTCRRVLTETIGFLDSPTVRSQRYDNRGS